MALTQEQRTALESLQKALQQATETGLFDELSAFGHPDRINRFCDDVADFHALQQNVALPADRPKG